MDFENFNDELYTLVNDRLIVMGMEVEVAGNVANAAAFHAEQRLREIRTKQEIKRCVENGKDKK